MITREELDKSISEIIAKRKELAIALDKVWGLCNCRHYTEVCDAIEHIQCDYGLYPEVNHRVGIGLDYGVFYKLLDENEQAKNLGEFLVMKQKLESIKHILGE